MLRYLRKRNTLLSICLAGILFFCSVHFNGFKVAAEEGTDIVLSNPRVNQDGPSEWDTIWFGHYWWDDTDMSGKADREDDMHLMQWRVLSVDEDKIFVVANQCVDFMPYSTKDLMSTWKTSGIRSWLNGYDSNVHFEDIDYTEDNFIDNAFSEEEQSYILETRNTNADNPKYLINGGRDSIDKIFLLSFEEVTNPAYGFSDGYGSSATRMIHKQNSFVQHGGTIPSKYHGAYMSNTKEYYSWWLRTPGKNREYAAFVDSYGTVDLKGERKSWDYLGVRPAMCLKRSVLYSGLCHSGKVVESDNDRYCWSDETKEYVLVNPRIDRELLRTTWDCIWFGRYWQKDTNGDGVADQRDEKSPILWRILEVDGERLFLIADQNLDVQKYNETNEDVKWGGSTLRSWLNGYDSSKNKNQVDYSNNNFVDNAFTDGEQAYIFDTELINKGINYTVDGGSNTIDKLFCMSYDEICTREFGFDVHSYYAAYNGLRLSTNTAFLGERVVDEKTTLSETGCANPWWLRTTGSDGSYASCIYGWGKYGTAIIDSAEKTVRPAMYLNKSALEQNAALYAGTVSRYKDVASLGTDPLEEYPNDLAAPRLAGKVSPSASSGIKPTEGPKETPTVEPDIKLTEAPKATPSVKPDIKPTKEPIETPVPSIPTDRPIDIPPTQRPITTADRSDIQDPNLVDTTNSGQGIYDEEIMQKSVKWKSVKLNKYNIPFLRWCKNDSVGGYQIYRSATKKGSYRLIKELSSADITSFKDKKAKRNKTYYYYIRGFQKTNQGKVYGINSPVKMLKVLNIPKPKVKLRAGVIGSRVTYIEFKLIHYKGSKINVYYRTKRGFYKQLKLRYNRIRNGKFKVRCSKKGKIYYFKVRTGVKKAKKIYYSIFSNVVTFKM